MKKILLGTLVVVLTLMAVGWRDTSDEYGLPGYLSDLFARSNTIRDEHFAQVILDLVAKDERVFAVMGSSHAVKLDAALRAALESHC